MVVSSSPIFANIWCLTNINATNCHLSFTNWVTVFVEKQPAAWKYWCEKARKHMGSWTGRWKLYLNPFPDIQKISSRRQKHEQNRIRNLYKCNNKYWKELKTLLAISPFAAMFSKCDYMWERVKYWGCSLALQTSCAILMVNTIEMTLYW